MINMDGPRHARGRKAVARAFSPRLLSRLTDGIRAGATRIVDDVVARGPGDFVAQVALLAGSETTRSPNPPAPRGPSASRTCCCRTSPAG
jgi:cytochrome P450